MKKMFTKMPTKLIAAGFMAFALNPLAQAAVIPEKEATELLITINEGEVDIGKVALKRAENKEVKDFAKMMVDEHKKNKKETEALAKKQKIGTEDGALSEAEEDAAEMTESDLKKKPKVEFDKAYVDSQVAGHTKVLQVIDETLIPSAKNEKFRTHLEQTREAVQKHLAHAKELQAKM